MAECERLIPLDDDDDSPPPAQHDRLLNGAGPAAFSRLSLARFSQRFRRGWTVAVDGAGGSQDKENATAATKRVKFDKRVYHGPVSGSRATCVRGILKTADRSASAGTANTVLRDCVGGDDVPNRMRLYDLPVTSFYIGAGESLPEPHKHQIKRCASMMAGRSEAKKYRRFGTDIGWLLVNVQTEGSVIMFNVC